MFLSNFKPDSIDTCRDRSFSFAQKYPLAVAWTSNSFLRWEIKEKSSHWSQRENDPRSFSIEIKTELKIRPWWVSERDCVKSCSNLRYSPTKHLQYESLHWTADNSSVNFFSGSKVVRCFVGRNADAGTLVLGGGLDYQINSRISDLRHGRRYAWLGCSRNNRFGRLQ